MRPFRVGIALAVLAGGFVCAQPALRLKSREAPAFGFQRDDDPELSRPSALRRTPGFAHIILQFEGQPGVEEIAELQRLGGRALGYVPDQAVLAVVPEEVDLATLALVRTERLQIRDKLSPAILAAPELAAQVLVQFHSDVEDSEARALLADAGVDLIDHPNLARHDYLVRATFGQLRRLAEWDEVSYIFPGSGDLSAGEPQYACLGGHTNAGGVGQAIASVGPGWALGKGAAQLKYGYGALSLKVDGDKIRAETVRALNEWSRVARLTFIETTYLTGPRTIAVRFGRGPAGGPLPFDGPGRVLAYTYYPSPPNPEPAAGDAYFDDDENWQVGADVDLFSVILHEFGHALGLAHSDVPGSVMYPYYRKATALTAEDVRGIQSLYAAADGGAPVPVPVPAAPPVAPPLPPAPAPTAVTLRIATPAATVTAKTVAVTGSASHSSGISRVHWVNSRGGAGQAVGASGWTASVPLSEGVNRITMTAVSGSGLTASAAVDMTLTTATATGKDTLAPSITIQTPALRTLSVATASIVVAGVASDNTHVSEVSWTNSSGATGMASGTTAWRAEVPLIRGFNTIIIRARDAAGNEGWRSLSVTRRQGSLP